MGVGLEVRVCLQSTGSTVIKGRQIRRIPNWKPLSRTQPSRELEAPGKVIDRGSACKPRSVRRDQRFTALRLCAPRQARSAPLRAFVPPLPRLGDHLSAPGRYRRARAAYPGLERSGQLLAPAWPCSGWGLPGRPIAGTAGGLLHHRFTLAPRFARSAPPDVLACSPRSRGAVHFCGPVRGSPRPGVTRHPALWSADFPRSAPHLDRSRRERSGPRSPGRPTGLPIIAPPGSSVNAARRRPANAAQTVSD